MGNAIAACVVAFIAGVCSENKRLSKGSASAVLALVNAFLCGLNLYLAFY